MVPILISSVEVRTVSLNDKEITSSLETDVRLLEETEDKEDEELDEDSHPIKPNEARSDRHVNGRSCFFMMMTFYVEYRGRMKKGKFFLHTKPQN